MNKPASGEGNWAWRMLPGQITPDVENWLRQSITMYNRK
jgi:4-alpha-glucanotransferase